MNKEMLMQERLFVKPKFHNMKAQPHDAGARSMMKAVAKEMKKLESNLNK